MTNNLLRDYSLKSFDNEEQSTYEKNAIHHLPNFFTMAHERKQNYSEKSFQFHFTAKQNKQKNEDNSLSRVNSSSYLSLNRYKDRRPLKQILRGNKQSLLYGISHKPRQNRRSPFATATKSIAAQQYTSTKHPTALQTNHLPLHTSNSLTKLQASVNHIKTLQSQINQPHSRSRSSKRKGLECTLYERSLQKKINESAIKSSKKMVTIKKRFEKTEEWGKDEQAGQKDIRKVLLKKKKDCRLGKEYEDGLLCLNSTNCFKSVVLMETRSKEKKMRAQQSQDKGSDKKALHLSTVSRNRVTENIKSVSRNKKQAFNDLNKSMNVIKQSCRQRQFTSVRHPTESKEKFTSLHQSMTKNNLPQTHLITPVFNLAPLPSSTQKPLKKILFTQRIQQNLNKIHQKYKFILNYLTDFDIIGKMNGFEVGGVEECKWILLIIDDVYEMIKHADQTKLKGIDYSREYEYNGTADKADSRLTGSNNKNEKQ